MGAIVSTLIFMAVFIGGFAGYIINIIAIAHTTGFSGLLILRVIGVFVAPLGALLGLFA
jgi:hypothetical protein